MTRQRLPVIGDHRVDDNGNPAGGTTSARGLTIEWQNGPLREVVGHSGKMTPTGVVDGRPTYREFEPNGAFVEDVLSAALDRIEFYQDSKFHCLENAIAIGHIKAALEVLDERTRGRERRGVEGTHQV